MKRKKTIGIISLCLIAIFGVTFAWFSFYQETSNKKLIGGDIYLMLVDNMESINITNVYPETPEEARDTTRHVSNTVTNNVMTFKIEGENNSPDTIYYEIMLKLGDEESSPLTRFKDIDIMFDLIEIGANNEETYIVNATSYPQIDNQRVYVGSVASGATIDKTFKLRMWLSDKVIVGDNNTYSDYTETGANSLDKHYASVKIGVYGDLEEKTLPVNFYNTIKDLGDDNSKTYVQNLANNQEIINNPSYTTQDTVKYNSNKQPIYYYTGADAKKYSNVLFGGFCWQIVRTTDDGGIRLLYNGKAIDNKCPKEEDRTELPKLIKGATGTRSFNLGASEYVYGKSFTYNENTNTFTLNDTFSATWSDNTYKDLIGTYTCATSTNCTTLYYVGHRQDDGTASVATYTIGNGTASQFSQIGNSAFTSFYDSPTLVGYQYGEAYNYILESDNATVDTATFSADVTWNGTKYTLSSTKTGLDNTHHYRCESNTLTDTECSVVRYYYRKYVDTNNNDATSYYYINLRNGKKIEEALKEMINYKNVGEADTNINKYDSPIKGLIENWYRMNLLEYDNFLDKDSVYCNNRTITSIGGWTRVGTLTNYIIFKQATSSLDLRCENTYDRFSVKNDKAKLSYPIGLLTEPERRMMGSDFAGSGNWWWLASPYHFYTFGAVVRYVAAGGSDTLYNSNYGGAVRPAITLMPGVTILDGTGDYDTPYIVNRVS